MHRRRTWRLRIPEPVGAGGGVPLQIQHRLSQVGVQVRRGRNPIQLREARTDPTANLRRRQRLRLSEPRQRDLDGSGGGDVAIVQLAAAGDCGVLRDGRSQPDQPTLPRERRARVGVVVVRAVPGLERRTELTRRGRRRDDDVVIGTDHLIGALGGGLCRGDQQLVGGQQRQPAAVPPSYEILLSGGILVLADTFECHPQQSAGSAVGLRLSIGVRGADRCLGKPGPDLGGQRVDGRDAPEVGQHLTGDVTDRVEQLTGVLALRPVVL